jgi:uncharacterized membrane protein YeaQ/YmgE (transglycosylase-associated protein family)
MAIIWFLLIGLISGWLAGLLTRGGGFGVIGDIIVGVLGAMIGGHVLGWFGVYTYGLLGSIGTAVVGAVILLSLIRALKRA